MTPSPRTCVSCSKPLAWNIPLTPRKAVPGELYALCPDFTCRTVFQQTEMAPGMDFLRELQLRVRAKREHSVWSARVQEHRRKLAEECDAVFATLAARPRKGPAPDLKIALPSGSKRQRRLSARRRQAYIAHLDAVIATALDKTAPSNFATAAGSTPSVEQNEGKHASNLLGRLCGACAGGCCSNGNDHAYLHADTIKRVMAANPGLSPAQVRAAYLERLPEHAMTDSCVNHTKAGCSLPRSLRSDVCNVFLCSHLQRLVDTLTDDASVRTVLVLRRRQDLWRQAAPGLPDNEIIDGAVLTETGMKRFRLPKPADPVA